ANGRLCHGQDTSCVSTATLDAFSEDPCRSRRLSCEVGTRRRETGMKRDRTFGRRLAQAVALVTLMTAGLVVGVPSGAAGFGLGLPSLADVVVVPGDAIVVDPGPQQPSADLSVAIADSTDPAIAGQGFDYGVTVQNLGPDTAAGIVLNINRSDNLEIKGVSGAVECQSDFSSCSLNRIPSGGVARVVLYVYANQA